MELIFIVAIFGLLMFFMSRANKKQRQAVADMRAGIDVGTKVVTNGGIYGEVVDIDGDVITIETTPGTEIMTARNFIAGITEPPFAVEDDETEGELDVTVPDDASSLTAEDDASTAVAEDGKPASASSAEDSGEQEPRA